MPVICQIGEHALVIMDDTNLKRVGDRDPLIIDVAAIAASSGRPVERLVLTYGNAEDIANIIELAKTKSPLEVFRYACRGYTRKPGDELGLHRIDPNGVSS